jgi:predicted ester cyclase
MSTEENKATIHRFAEAMNAQNEATFDAIATPAAAQEAKDTMLWAYATFVGHHMDVTDLIAEGERIVARLATQGGHSGEWEGIPATGKQWTNTGVMFFQFADGKITAFEGLFDGIGHLKQLWATIMPPASTHT